MSITVRRARAADVRGIVEVVRPLVESRVLLSKEWVTYFESLQEFRVAEGVDGTLAGCGALHVHVGRPRRDPDAGRRRPWIRRGSATPARVARRGRAPTLGLPRLFCLTFEVDFFEQHGFNVIDGTPVPPDVYAELVRSPDEGVAEFLDLARVKPNTLGNSRMLRHL